MTEPSIKRNDAMLPRSVRAGAVGPVLRCQCGWWTALLQAEPAQLLYDHTVSAHGRRPTDAERMPQPRSTVTPQEATP